MTTIAASREMMAGDTRYTDGGLEGKTKTKIYKVNGDLIGYAGSLAEGMAFRDWYKDREKERPDISNTTILVLQSSGILLTYEGCYYPLEIDDFDFYAIGSGAHFAMGAMMAGKDPQEAVKIAARLDNGSGPPVRALRL